MFTTFVEGILVGMILMFLLGGIIGYLTKASPALPGDVPSV